MNGVEKGKSCGLLLLLLFVERKPEGCNLELEWIWIGTGREQKPQETKAPNTQVKLG